VAEHDRTDLEVIGKPLPKIDARLGHGQLVYADDVVLPRMAAVAALAPPPRPPEVHRHLQAAALPGVLATLVGSELPIPWILPVSQDEHRQLPDTARLGDPVAAVAAVDEETAEAALALIAVEYQVLPALMSTTGPARPDCRINEHGSHGNVHKEVLRLRRRGGLSRGRPLAGGHLLRGQQPP
jgi:CO/xanthine dehydrogenase Mo-binding subunit